MKNSLHPELLQTQVSLQIDSLPKVLDRFEEQFQRFSSKVAIEYGSRRVTYAELDQRVNTIAENLWVQGYGQGTLVGVWLDDKVELIASMIAVLKLGGIFVPFDPTYPLQRLKTMLTVVDLNLILTDEANHEVIAEVLAGCDHVPVLSLVNELHHERGYAQKDERMSGPGDDDPIYIYFTSGSTGKPKGILGRYAGLSHFVDWEIRTLGLTDEIRVSQLVTPSFDAFLRDVFVPLCAGGTLCIPESRDQVVNGDKLSAWVTTSHVQLIHCVPSVFKLLNTPNLREDQFPALRYILMSGERINPAILQNWYRAMGSRVQLVNLYGPSETTMVKTYYYIQPEDAEKDSISIGQPMEGAQVLILDEELQLCPEGVAGEIGIRTPYMSLGYYHDPVQTAEKFIVNPFSELAEDRIYRTGDLGRWLPNGQLEFLGRRDHQVKVRGVRVELGEIENQLLHFSGVKEAVVVDREDIYGNVTLCAYIVPREEFAIGDLREYLVNHLPDYMIPSFFVKLDTMPLTDNGKIDRKALPLPDESMRSGVEYLTPRNALEERLAAIWSEVLGVQRIGVHSHFFELGGHSLSGGYLAARVYQEFGVDLALRSIFQHPTLGELAGFIESAEKKAYREIGIAPTSDLYLASSAQRRLYALQQMDVEKTTYNLPHVLTITGDLDHGRLVEAVQELVRRHAAFRTSFVIQAGELYQRVQDEGSLLVKEREDTSESIHEIARAFVQPFDLHVAPLLRAELIRMKDGSHLFLFDMHHIISDGTSCGIFLDEVWKLYAGEALPPLRIEYKDYTAWQREIILTQEYQQEEEFWLGQFQGEVPVLHLPTDFPRPIQKTFAGNVYGFSLTSEWSQKVNELASRQGVTLFMVLLAAYNTLLAKYSGQQDIVVGTGLAGRSHADLEHLVGMFVNTLAMRNQPMADKSFTSFLHEVRENALKVYENQDYQFETLVDKLNIPRDLSRNPLFDVVFVLQNVNLTQMSCGGLHITPQDVQKTTAKFDLTLNAYEAEEGLRFEWEYSTELFTSATIQRMTEHFVRILEVVTMTPAVTLGDICMISDVEQEALLCKFNQTATDYPRHRTVNQLFEERAAEMPEQAAVTYEGEMLTYAALNARANQLARALQIRGIQRGEIVGIMVERSLNMITALLGILKAGAAYLPIDPGYPQARIEFMLADSETRYLLTQESFFNTVPAFTGQRMDLSDPALYTGDETNLDAGHTAADLAYVIYTSGTTGKPKGTLTMHSNISRVVLKTNYIQIGSDDRVLQLSNYAFDGSTFDIYGALLNGATLVIPHKDIILEPARLASFIETNGITIFFVTTALFNTLVEMNVHCFDTVRKVLFGGERVSVQHVRKALAHLGVGRIIHVYGPTESTVFASYYPIDAIDERVDTVPIGRPLANTEIYIVDSQNHLQPIGVVGELCISGEGLARGYLKRPELTAEKFVDNPFCPGTIMYRTGDLARWLEGGEIEFVGRVDLQVKIRGFRIELGEIESELLKHPAIKEAIVIDRTDAMGNKYLCAYMVTTDDLSIDGLRKHLAVDLPEYMIPAYFVRLSAMPLNVNGKIDRRALPEPDGSVELEAEYVAPTNPQEEILAQIWQETLGVRRVGIHDNFFALGGHSLKATFLAARMYQEFNVELPLRVFFQLPTVAELAQWMKTAKAGGYSAIETVPEAAWYQVSPAQKRMLVMHQLDSQSLTYNVPFIWIVEGPFQRRKFERAIRTLIARHESLRTSFALVDGAHVQVIHPEVDFEIAYFDVAAEELDEVIAGFVRPFDLTKAPILRVGVVRMEERYAFMLDMHHIVTDGVSMDVFLKELAKLYDGEALPPLRIQYKDYAAWQLDFLQSAEVQGQEAYWLNAFSGDLPQLNLPTDRPRPSVKSNQGAVIHHDVSQALQAKLHDFARNQGATLYMVLLAAYNLLLSKYSGQEDIIVGTPMAGRPHADVAEVVGMFVNTLAIRNYPAPQKTFADFLAEVKETVLKVTENQDYQFETLVERLGIPRDMSRNPLFDVMLNVENANEDFAIRTQELQFTPYHYDIRIAKFDLLLFVFEKVEGMQLELQYSTDLFEQKTVERFLEHYVNLLGTVIAEPELRMAEISMLSERERNQLLFDFTDTHRAYPQGKTIHRLFEERVAVCPERIAVEFEGKTLTYRELNGRANQLAHLLRKHGVGAETVVGLMLERSLEMAVSLLGILKSGGAYLPIDPEYPKERILYMLKDANAKILLTKNQYIRELSYTALQNFEANEIELVLTAPRGHIKEFNALPIPDRSYIDMTKYRDHIGMASVNRCIGLQTTRGCPYLCLYCHKVWSKSHVYRSAENIFSEIEYYYQRGVSNFAILDDCFNLNRENSARVFQMIVNRGMKIKIFFPNGLRGDLLTPEYIDLMVEAGTVNINLSLETASPRLQKLVKKYLDIDKFKRVMEYIATQHPQVILELATMHGFPTETEEEAMQTLNFIKDIKWIHFPYIHILKVFPNTEIEELALANGVSKEDIMRSVNRAYHELPETLPFPKSFTRQYQAEFLNEYFLSKERLRKVIPVQLGILSEEALVEKYNAYLPIEVKRLKDVLEFAGVTDLYLPQLDAPLPSQGACGAVFPILQPGSGEARRIITGSDLFHTMPTFEGGDRQHLEVSCDHHLQSGTLCNEGRIGAAEIIPETKDGSNLVGETTDAMTSRANTNDVRTALNTNHDVIANLANTNESFSILRDANGTPVSIFDLPPAPRPLPAPGVRKILLLDLSQHFSSEDMLYKVYEQPLGLMYLMTYLKQQFGEAIDGRIYKSGIDFDSFDDLKAIIDGYQPDLIGIRTLTFYKEFFHQTAAVLRQWGVKAPIITGGPYATSEYNTLLKDANVDIVVLGEGEYIMEELIREMLKTEFKLPESATLRRITGIAFAEHKGVDQSCEVMPLEALAALLPVEETSDLAPLSTDANLAYVMYTSGTTGKPKGIMVEHRQVNNCINWMQEKFPLDTSAVVIQRTNLTFDPSVWEVFWPLYLGAKVHFLTTDQGKNAEFLIDLLTENTELTLMYTPASLLAGITYLLNAKEPKGKLRLPWFLIGAEPISMDVVKNFYQYFEGRIVNTYGPTECTINNTYYELHPDDPRTIVPIGYPVANNQIYILSKQLDLMPIGLPGEICIAGDSVARGYMNNPEKTAEVFVENPFGSGKLYKTGDVGRWLPDGSIEISGRVDDQVKVRGYRIELGEIEIALMKHEAIREAVVVVKDTKKSKDEIKVCKKCGITTAYPDIEIHEEGICNVCESQSAYKKAANDYFGTLEGLDALLKTANQKRESEYDCLLLYAGGRGSAYALYQLVERGFKVLVATYDNGYLGGSALRRIKQIVEKLGCDHIVLTHPNTDQILRASLEVASTVCQGCFLCSSSLAQDYAMRQKIRVVIGATLSRGQIMENKLFKLFRQGITDVAQVEAELSNLQRVTYSMSEEITKYINVETLEDGSVHDHVKVVDFYRYCDITNEEMISYLNAKDPYWRKRKNYAIYSTNCPIKQIGDFAHLQEKGYHYYGSATSWERRFGHITGENLQEDLQCNVTPQGFANFVRQIGYKKRAENQIETKFLAAYIVSDPEIPVNELREFLGHDLPDYMIPSYFMTLDQLPLTNNGKIDKKALPEPTGNISLTEYVAPTNEAEEQLAMIWAEILGVKQVGIHDNFFELGGDSIKAIQILARTNQVGISITVKDVFVYKTIGKLLENVDYTRTKEYGSQDEVTGDVLLTPIQQWFFEQNLDQPQYWNQREIFTLPADVDLPRLEIAFRKLIEHHDALRMGYQSEAGLVHQRNRAMSEVEFKLQIIDLSDESAEVQKARLVEWSEGIQNRLNLTEDLLIQGIVFDLGVNGMRLLIPVHHLIIDGISWRIIVEDLENLYASNLEATLPWKTTSFQEWSQKLHTYAQNTTLDLAYWQRIDARQVQPIATAADNYWSDHRTVSVRLTSEETEVLLTKVNWAYNTEINDTLLSALTIALTTGFGIDQILLNLEGHGREEIIEGVDLSRTIGWFTSAYPVYFEKQGDLADTIKHVKENLRRVPEKGILFGIGRYLAGVEELQDLNPQISFNYLGQFGGGKPEAVKPRLLGECTDYAGRSLHRDNQHTFLIDVNGMVKDGALEMTFSYNARYLSDARMETVGALFRESLLEIIIHCTSQEDKTYTASDFDAEELDQDDLDEIAQLYEF